MLLATTRIQDFDRFMAIFTTKAAEKREEHGSKGAVVYRNPDADDRVWVVYNWNEEGWQSYISDPAVPPILEEAGVVGLPQTLTLVGAQPS